MLMDHGFAVKCMLMNSRSRVTLDHGDGLVLDSLLYGHQVLLLCPGLHKEQPI